MDQPAQRAEFHRLMAVGFQQLGEVDKAVESFVKLAAMDFGGDLAGESDRAGLMRVHPNLKIRRDRWIRTHMADLLASATDDARGRIDATVSNHLDDILRSGSIAGLTRFVNHFGDHALGIRARLHLAELLVHRNRALEAQQHLIDLQRVGDESVAATATALLADLLRAQGHVREAIACYELLEARWGDVTTAHGSTGGEWAAQAGSDPALLAAKDPAAPWPYGKCMVSVETQAASNAAYLSSFPIELTAVQGPFPDAMSLVYDRQRNAVVLRDRHGKPVHQLALGDASRFLPSSPSVAGRIGGGQRASAGAPGRNRSDRRRYAARIPASARSSCGGRTCPVPWSGGREPCVLHPTPSTGPGAPHGTPSPRVAGRWDRSVPSPSTA